MLINKVAPFQTQEETDRKNRLLYKFFEVTRALCESDSTDTDRFSSRMKKCLTDMRKIEDEAAKRYIFSFGGDKSAVMRDIQEILLAVTPDDFQSGYFREEGMYPSLVDYYSLDDTDREEENRRNYTDFCIHLAQMLHAQAETFIFTAF